MLLYSLCIFEFVFCYEPYSGGFEIDRIDNLKFWNGSMSEKQDRLK